MSASTNWTGSMTELPGVGEDGMSGRNGQRKLGTTRGSPRRSRTAKASRISRRAAKSRCACEWDGWGRLSDDGSGHDNPNPSEDPWGGGVITLQGGAQSSPRPDAVRDKRPDYDVHEGRNALIGRAIFLALSLSRRARRSQNQFRVFNFIQAPIVNGRRLLPDRAAVASRTGFQFDLL